MGDWSGVVAIIGGGVDELRVVMRWGCMGIVDDGGGWGTREERVDDGQNSYLQNLPTSILGKRIDSWYVEHKMYMYNNAFVVQLVEHLHFVLYVGLWGQVFDSVTVCFF